MTTDKWTDRAAALFKEGTEFRKRREYAAARSKYHAALDELLPNQLFARGGTMREIGSTFYLDDDPQLALPWFEAARDLMPESELSSLCLFHCLYDLGRREEALLEALRFCQLRQSEEYRNLFCPPFRGNVPQRLQELGDRLRKLLGCPSTEQG